MIESTQSTQPLYIHACAAHSALGDNQAAIRASLLSGTSLGMQQSPFTLTDGKQVIVGRALGALPSIGTLPSIEAKPALGEKLPHHHPHHNTRNNQLALSALQHILPDINHAKARFGPARIAVILGSTTSGISDGEQALRYHQTHGQFPPHFDYYQQELSNLADFVSAYCGLSGLQYTISTACSSSGRTFISANRLLQSGLADAVIVGGCDTLCSLTLNGFNALESLSSTLCQPFSEHRDGINVGEAAAFMLLSLTPPPHGPAIALLGIGESSDAYHISAPDPKGLGAEKAMRAALTSAQLSPNDIGYINAHGTATVLNDAMEASAIYRVFSDSVPVSSTKPLTGHTLGAASAIEASICWQLLRDKLPIPVSAHQAPLSASLASICLANIGDTLQKNTILTNSFAFGGNNVSLIFGII